MRILNLTDFKKMPLGTIYSKYKPCMFGDINVLTGISHTTIDFSYTALTGNIACFDTGEFVDNCTAMQRGESRPLDFDVTEGDGLYEKDALFAVYEADDLEGLLVEIMKALKVIRNGVSLWITEK